MPEKGVNIGISTVSWRYILKVKITENCKQHRMVLSENSRMQTISYTMTDVKLRL